MKPKPYKVTSLSKTFTFTPKVNSKQKKVKKTQKHKNRCSDSTHGCAYRTHDRAAQGRATRTVLSCRAHGRARLTAQILQFFSFRHFALKIPTVNLISILFSPMCSSLLNLSHSIRKFQIQSSQNSFPKSLIITYFYKIT